MKNDEPLAEEPICEQCHHLAKLRVNGIYVCLDHADLASEEDDNEIESISNTDAEFERKCRVADRQDEDGR